SGTDPAERLFHLQVRRIYRRNRVGDPRGPARSPQAPPGRSWYPKRGQGQAVNPTLDLSGLERLTSSLRKLQGTMSDARPLMDSWQRIVDDGNRRGILAGLDARGVPMTPVRYRPTIAKPKRPTFFQKNLPKGSRARRG